MKNLKIKVNILILFALFATSNLNAQLNAAIGGGYSFNNYPVYELKFGYELHRINFNGGFSRSLNRNSNTHIYSGAEIGFNLLNEGDAYLLAHSIIISGGYWYDKINSDQKAELSAWRPSISLRYIQLLKENAGLYGQLMYINNNVLLTAGMLLKFN